MSGCSNYVENVWRKGKCANCFRAKDKHLGEDAKHKVKDGGDIEKCTGLKKATNGINGHSSDEQKPKKGLSVKRGDNSIRATIAEDGKGSESGLRKSTRNTSDRGLSCESSPLKSEEQNFGTRTHEGKEITNCTDKPKPIPRPRGKGSSRCSVSLQEELSRPSSSASDCSRSSCTPEALEEFEDREICTPEIENSKLGAVQEGSKDDNNPEISSCEIIPGRLDGDQILGDLKTIKLANSSKGVNDQSREIASGGLRKLKKADRPDVMDLKIGSTVKDLADGDEVYMPMKNNVCEAIDDKKTADGIQTDDKISRQSLSDSSDDRNAKEVNRKTGTYEKSKTKIKRKDSEVEQDVQKSNGLGQGILKMGSEASSASDIALGSEKNYQKESSSMEPFYENRQSTGSEGHARTSSDSGPVTCNGASRVTMSSGSISSYNNELLSKQGKLGEKPSMFEDIVNESSGNSSESSSSDGTWGSSTWDSCSASEILEHSGGAVSNVKGTKTVTIAPQPSDPEIKSKRLDPEMVKKRQSNPDIKEAIEGPTYMNAAAKPVTKPYKVVDISTGMLVRGEEEEQSDTPPLPPKERELNLRKEEGTFDHYYCEPPEDIVPDYKKLTPLQNKDPPPDLIVTRVPGGLKSVPVPRRRSQLPSHSSTLPRPVPRAVKGVADMKDNIVRPVSQVVTRSPRADAPKPPSTSTIPTRKPSAGSLSPTNSPTESPPQTPGSPEGQKLDGAGTAVESKDQGLKPKRVAPPPPVGTCPQSTSSTSLVSTQDQPNTSSSPVRTTQTQIPMRSLTLTTLTLPSGKSSPKSGIKKALSSWKRLSGRRKGKRKLEISAPILVNEEIPSFAAQQYTLRKRLSVDSTTAVCTSIKEINKEEVVVETVDTTEDVTPPAESAPEGKDTPDATSPPVPTRKRGHSYQNFPFSKSGEVEKPQKPNRPGKAVQPVEKEKLAELNLETRQENPAYLEPCKNEMTLKVETALANLNDAQILAEALSRVEQERLGPLPEVPKSRRVRFGFNATVATSGNRASKEGKPSLPKRPMRAVSSMLVNGVHDKGKQAEGKPCLPRYPSRPPNTKPSSIGVRGRSKTVGGTHPRDQHLGSPRARSLSMQDNPIRTCFDKILEMHIETLQDVVYTSRLALLPGDNVDLSNTCWRDYEVCGRALDVKGPGAVLLPIKCPKVDEELRLLARVKYPKALTEDMSQRTAFMQDMSITVSTPTHVNISRTLTHFTDTIPGEVFNIPGDKEWETLVTVTDQVPVETVAEFMERTVEEHEDLPDEYERKVCVLLIQLFCALEHLHGEGIAHRDLRMENLLLLDHGYLIVANFAHALQQQTDTSPFVYSTDSIVQMGGDTTRLPPEIHLGFKTAETLDFERCDCFAAGCLTYELLHEKNPFSADPNLIKTEYLIDDLPQLTERSRFTCGLGILVSGLLQRNPSERMLPKDGLQLLQAFLWGPEQLDDSCLELSASDWLETERACAVVAIARSQSQSSSPGGEEFVENFLRYQYLVDVTEDEVIDSYNATAPIESLSATI